MAIQINLEKYGHKKKGYLSFSWTSLLFDFFVPLFRLDFKWFFIFLFPYLFYILLLLKKLILFYFFILFSYYLILK